MECRNKITLINDCAIAPLKSQNGSYEKLCRIRARDYGMELNWSYVFGSLQLLSTKGSVELSLAQRYLWRTSW